jgi:hypothetical protein
MCFPNGYLLINAGECHGAIKWLTVSPDKADSHDFSFKSEFGESTFNRRHVEYQGKSYEDWAEQNSQDSHTASKKCESGPVELQDCPVCGCNEWEYTSTGELQCQCGYKNPEYILVENK